LVNLPQVYKAAEMIKAGFPAQEIFEYLEEYKTRIQVLCFGRHFKVFS